MGERKVSLKVSCEIEEKEKQKGREQKKQRDETFHEVETVDCMLKRRYQYD